MSAYPCPAGHSTHILTVGGLAVPINPPIRIESGTVMNKISFPRIRPRLALLFLLGLALALFAFAGLHRGQAKDGPAPLDPHAGVIAEARVSASSLNLRTGPHVSYTAVAYLMEGEQVQMVGRNRTGTWVQIALYNGYRGWVNASYIRPTIDIAALPIVDVALWGSTAFVTNDPIPVYAGPDRGYQLVGRAQPGEVLALSGRNDAATWIHVYLPDGRAGWVAADSPFLPTASLNDLPILTPFLDSAPTNLASFFFVYAGPGFVYEPMDSVEEGQTLAILGRTADNRWVLVRLADGREGWIAAEIIQIAAPLDNVPVVHGIAPPQVVGWQTSGQSAGQTSPVTPTAGATGGSKQPSIPTGSATPEPTATPTATAAAPTPEPSPTGTGTATPIATDMPTATATGEATPTHRATATEETPATPGATGDLTPPPGLPIVYVYPTPDEDATPILRVVPGQSVVLIGRTADSEWIKIWLTGGQEGWVQAAALELEIDIAVLPVVEP